MPAKPPRTSFTATLKKAKDMNAVGIVVPLEAVAAKHRVAAGVDGGDTLRVTLELDTEPRVTPVAADLKAALTKAKVRAAFAASAPSKRKEWVRQVDDAKTPETRARRILKVVDALKA